MIVKRVSIKHLPMYTFPEALSLGIKKLLLTSLYGKIYIVTDDQTLMGYYSLENYKSSGTFDIQLDTVCLQEDEVEDGQSEVYVPLTADGTDYGILPIISSGSKVVGAALCTDDAWRNDMILCLSKLEYLRNKDMSLEYWFREKNYKKIALCPLNELSLAFADEIMRYEGIEVLGIYGTANTVPQNRIDPYNYDSEVHILPNIENAVEEGADLVIVTDWAMRHLEDYPQVMETDIDVIYAPKILNLNMPPELYVSQMNKDYMNADVSRYVNAELCNRCKEKYRAMGVHFQTVAVPSIVDMNIHKHFELTIDNISDWVAEQNGWDPRGKEIAEFMKGRHEIAERSVKKGGRRYGADIKTEYINVVNKSRVVLNAPAEYKNTVYLLGPCIVGGFLCKDEQTLGYYLQENLIDRGLEYRVVPVHMIVNADIYYHMKVLEEFDIKEGDMIFRIDAKYTQSEWDLDLMPTFEKMYEKYGDSFFMDEPIHSAKEGSKAVADFLIDHIGTPAAYSAVSSEQPRTQADLPQFTGSPQLKKYQEFIQSSAIHKMPKIGSIVMNCNPFTLGHLYLVEYAARQVDYLYVFVVEEDKSFFKFEDRMKLVNAGTSHLENVKVLPSGQFIISSVTFSQYFEKENLDGVAIDTSTDVETFGSQIAPCLNITVRFVGEEPLDPVTAQYNRSMKEILPKYGVELCEIPRKETEGMVISASRVRKCLEEKNWEEIRKLVPETTYLFLEEKFG